jgi:hypothetical protein
MQRLEGSGAVRPLKWPLGVKWLKNKLLFVNLKLMTHVIQRLYRYASLNDGGYVLRNASLGDFVVVRTS